MKISFFLLCVIFSITLHAQITQPEASEVWEPIPRAVHLQENGIPSDAIILFDGQNLDQWEARWEDRPANWKVENGMFTVVPGTGDIHTKESFGSVQLHLEYRSPAIIEGEGQGRGNSGVFFQSRYEVQILDSYQNRTYSNGQAGSIYKQHMPLVNSNKAPGEWNVYDIIFEAPQFNSDSIKVKSGYLTVFQNGVLIQNHKEILGTTEYIGFPKNKAHGDDRIILQDHSNPVSFRNIWIRKL